MAGQLSNKGEELVLNTLFRDGTKPVYLGLSTSIIDDTSTLATISEVNVGSYTRRPVTFSVPTQESDKATIKNSANVDFSAWSIDQPTTIISAFLTYAQTGTAGDILAYFSLDAVNQIKPVTSQPARVPANGLVIQLT